MIGSAPFLQGIEADFPEKAEGRENPWKSGFRREVADIIL